MPLSCGGKGPCCHVGYAHRHCEHCDVVIDTRTAGWWYPWMNPVYPYQPHWLTDSTGQATQQGVASGTMYMEALNSQRVTSADQPYNVKALPDPTAAHLTTALNNAGSSPAAFETRAHICEVS